MPTDNLAPQSVGQPRPPQPLTLMLDGKLLRALQEEAKAQGASTVILALRCVVEGLGYLRASRLAGDVVASELDDLAQHGTDTPGGTA